MASRGKARHKRHSHHTSSAAPAVPRMPLVIRKRAPGQEGRAGQPGLFALSMGALGVVYGDIGTSPLYAFRESFLGENQVAPSIPNVLGVLSLVFWTLVIVVCVKYLIFVMRLDNNGEGGILALASLLRPGDGLKRRWFSMFVVLGIFGACLLYGDGMITPAISVLSAIEGLKLATPTLTPFVVPITIAVLVLLFVFQRRGTSKVGAVFGPVMLLWFATLAVLGLRWIIREPQVLAALNPAEAVRFFLGNGGKGFQVLGAVVLVVTGGEALYADLGHFGKRPIRISWFVIVFPALLLNYFGQGAQLLSHPGIARQPFFNLAPDWALIPLVILSTAATVIASQAIISGAFSLTRQASILRYLPPVRIIQTSSDEIGQIYIPSVNWILMVATIGLVLGFRTSSNLAGAYGVAVTTTMVITTILANVVARQWGIWTPWTIGALTGVFLLVDLSYFSANILKVPEGGWFPLAVAALIYILMATWKRGRENLAQRTTESQPPLDQFLRQLGKHLPVRVPGTAVFLTRHRETTPVILTHHLQHDEALHEQVVLCTLAVEPKPHVPQDQAVEVENLSHGFHRVVYHYGFMQPPNVPLALEKSKAHGLEIDLDSVTYYLQRQTVIPSPEIRGMAMWRERMFAFMARNSMPSASFFHIPSEKVVELGVEVEI